jgi:protease-4
MESFYRPYTDEERVIIRDKLTYFYGRFVGTVAKGRGISEKEVDEVARGRVWSGKMARGVKLVDAMGGVGDAIDYAKQLAHLGADERVRIVELPRASGGLLELLLGGIARAKAEETVELTELPGVRALLRGLPASLLVAPDSAQARMPFDLTFD